MTLPARTQLLVTTGVLTLLVVGVFFMILSVWLPRMELARATIQRNDAAVEAIQRQQENVSELSKQLEDRQAEKAELDGELWVFSNEDKFFTLWDAFGTPHKTTVTVGSVDDATPGPTPIEREAILSVTGSLANVITTIQSMSTLTPAVVLREVRFGPDSETPGSTVAQVTVSTLWYDDTLR